MLFRSYFSTYRIILERETVGDQGDTSGTSVPWDPSPDPEAVFDLLNTKEEFSISRLSSCDTKECVEASEKLRRILRKEFLDFDRTVQPDVDTDVEDDLTAEPSSKPTSSSEAKPKSAVAAGKPRLRYGARPTGW